MHVEPKYSPQEVALIRNRCAPKADDAAFDQLMYLATEYNLDPLLKEIWCVTDNKNNHRIQVARDGFLKIAVNHPAFDGMHSDTVCEGDFYAFNNDGTIQHHYGVPRGPIIGGYCVVFRKDRRVPAYFYAPIAEYRAGSPIWQSYPSSMIIKVAESMALKRGFGLSGLTSAEEMDATMTPYVELPKPLPEAKPAALPEQVAPIAAEQAAPVAEPVQPTRNEIDTANFMAQANGAPPPVLAGPPMTNKQRATITDLLANPNLTPEQRAGAEAFFAAPDMDKEKAQAGIDRLMQLAYKTA